MFPVNQKRKIQASEQQTEVKLSKKSQEEEKQVGNEELIAVKTVKTLDQLTEALNRDGCNLKKIIFVPLSLCQIWKNKKRETTCNNSTSEINFGQEFQTAKPSAHKIC